MMTPRLGLVIRMVLVGVLSAGAVGLTALLVPATAGTGAAPPVLMAGQRWLIKDNDLAVLDGLGSYQWVGCGLTTAPLAHVNFSPCHAGQDPIYASAVALIRAMRRGVVPRGATAIYDPEIWVYTPHAEQVRPWYYSRLAGLSARYHHVTLIVTPYEKSQTGMIAADAHAARYAAVIDIQAQFAVRTAAPGANSLASAVTDGRMRAAAAGSRSLYASFVTRAVTAIRKASKRVVILAGLATDAGGIPVTAGQMFAAYTSVKRIVQGWWLNANTWAAPRGIGCAPVGCPLAGRAFLAKIGARS